MSKKSGGLLTLITGIAAGAAAVFFSKSENTFSFRRGSGNKKHLPKTKPVDNISEVFGP